VQQIVAKYARRAGVPDVTPHVPRHTFAKHVLGASEDLATVQRLLGHERQETTAISTPPPARDLEETVRCPVADADRRSAERPVSKPAERPPGGTLVRRRRLRRPTRADPRRRLPPVGDREYARLRDDELRAVLRSAPTGR